MWVVAKPAFGQVLVLHVLKGTTQGAVGFIATCWPLHGSPHTLILSLSLCLTLLHMLRACRSLKYFTVRTTQVFSKGANACLDLHLERVDMVACVHGLAKGSKRQDEVPLILDVKTAISLCW